MTKNPFINGIAATGYIILIAAVMNFGSKMASHPNTFLAPIAFISLFTLSAAVMGYIFCYQPAQFYFENKKKQAVKLFLETTLIFALITVLALVLLFSGRI
jgi:heme O synthase-like polyprenyltransferase